MSEANAVRQIDLDALSGDPSRRRQERRIRRFFFGAAMLSIVISGAIVFSLFGNAFNFITNVDLGSLWSSGWFPRRGLYDIKSIFIGTMVIAGVGMLVATPLGLGAAIYLAEYARPKVRRVLKPIIEVLAGIPSVVIGFFALAFISPDVVQRLFTDASFFNMLSAGIGVGILVTPLVATISEDAMRSVPLALREASYGLGARKMATTVRVVIPAAVSGIVASLIIGLSRGIGETMVVTMAAGQTGAFTLDPLDPGLTMTSAMTQLAIGSDQVKGAAFTFDSLFFVGLLLFLMTLLLNVLSERFVRKVRQRY